MHAERAANGTDDKRIARIPDDPPIKFSATDMHFPEESDGERSFQIKLSTGSFALGAVTFAAKQQKLQHAETGTVVLALIFVAVRENTKKYA